MAHEKAVRPKIIDAFGGGGGGRGGKRGKSCAKSKQRGLIPTHPRHACHAKLGLPSGPAKRPNTAF